MLCFVITLALGTPGAQREQIRERNLARTALSPLARASRGREFSAAWLCKQTLRKLANGGNNKEENA